MHLVHKKNCFARIHLALRVRLVYGLAYVFYAREHGVKRNKIALGVMRNHAGESRFSRSGRTIKNNRRELVCGNGAAQQPPLAHNVFLSNVFIKAAGPHARSERFF